MARRGRPKRPRIVWGSVVAWIMVLGVGAGVTGHGGPVWASLTGFLGRVIAASNAASDPSPSPAPSGAPSEPVSQPAGSQSAAAQPIATGGLATQALATLVVRGRGPLTGYSRDAFGQAWADVDHNGCDTRNDIMRRDLTAKVFQKGSTCVIASGLLADPYSGSLMKFLQGNTTSSLIQIDHVVPLANAWVSGAQAWPAARRLTYANDPLVLLAVNGSLNSAKGAGDAATWLPPNRSDWCSYVARQIAVKAAYQLSVTAAEKVAMQKILGTCPMQKLPQRSGDLSGDGSGSPSRR
jgi:hypothetical protein